MRSFHHEHWRFPNPTMWLAVALVFSFSLSAAAELGGDVSSVLTDQARMKATVKSTESRSYTVQELKDPSGTVVREYVSPEEKVFAVAWQGPFLPNLRDLLGQYFTAYSQALQAAKARHPGRGPVNIQQPGLVVQSGGHARAFTGRAYLPSLMPQGVQAEEIR